MEKTCPRCKLAKDESHFAPNKGRKSGLSSYCGECARALARLIRLAERHEVLKHYGGEPPKCACCGEDRFEFLSIDHINGGGKEHIKSIGYTLARWLKKNHYPEGYRVLCHNCNFALGHYGYCPHKTNSTIKNELELYSKNYSGRGGRRRTSLSADQVKEIKRRLSNGEDLKLIAADFGVYRTTIYKIQQGITWKNVISKGE